MAFRFAQMTDSHLYAGLGRAPLETIHDMYRRMGAECAAHDVDFIVNTGDLGGGSCTIVITFRPHGSHALRGTHGPGTHS